MINPHYTRTIDRYVDELARKSARAVHIEATRQLMREVASLAKTIAHLAACSLDDGPQGEEGNE